MVKLALQKGQVMPLAGRWARDFRCLSGVDISYQVFHSLSRLQKVTDHLYIVPVLEGPAMAVAIVMIIILMLLALRLCGPALLADATFVFEMFLHVHVLLSSIL